MNANSYCCTRVPARLKPFRQATQHRVLNVCWLVVSIVLGEVIKSRVVSKWTCQGRNHLSFLYFVVFKVFRFNKKYFYWAISLFIIEVLIALFVKDRFVRPYVGDYLVVILMYTFIRAFVKTPVIITAVIVLLFAYLVEVLQYFDIVGKLGLERNRIARTVIGYGFEWLDLLAYSLGIITVLFIERRKIEMIKEGGLTKKE